MSRDVSADRARGRLARHRRLRKKIVGWPDRPRLCVFRSHHHCYAQLVDDRAGNTLKGWSTRDERLKPLGRWGTVQAAQALGGILAEDAARLGIRRVVFDRGGYLYHGRVKALAEAVRSGGIHV